MHYYFTPNEILLLRLTIAKEMVKHKYNSYDYLSYKNLLCKLNNLYDRSKTYDYENDEIFKKVQEECDGIEGLINDS